MPNLFKLIFLAQILSLVTCQCVYFNNLCQEWLDRRLCFTISRDCLWDISFVTVSTTQAGNSTSICHFMHSHDSICESTFPPDICKCSQQEPRYFVSWRTNEKSNIFWNVTGKSTAGITLFNEVTYYSGVQNERHFLAESVLRSTRSSFVVSEKTSFSTLKMTTSLFESTIYTSNMSADLIENEKFSNYVDERIIIYLAIGCPIVLVSTLLCGIFWKRKVSQMPALNGKKVEANDSDILKPECDANRIGVREPYDSIPSISTTTYDEINDISSKEELSSSLSMAETERGYDCYLKPIATDAETAYSFASPLQNSI